MENSINPFLPVKNVGQIQNEENISPNQPLEGQSAEIVQGNENDLVEVNISGLNEVLDNPEDDNILNAVAQEPKPIYYDENDYNMAFELYNSGVLKIRPDYWRSEPFAYNDIYMNDVKMIKDASDKGINPKDAYIKNFKTSDEALNALQTGDLCQIEGEKYISIKSQDGTIKPLNVTGDTFMMLFPPGDRFNIQQAQAGDCYLLTALNIMQSNPETREALYRCFVENDDGTVSVSIPISEDLKDDPLAQSVVFTVPINENTDIRDYASTTMYDKTGSTKNNDGSYTYSYQNETTEGSYISESCVGIQMLENVYGLQLAVEESATLIKSLNASHLSYTAATPEDLRGVTYDSKEGAVQLYHDFDETLRGNGGKPSYVMERFLCNDETLGINYKADYTRSDRNYIDAVMEYVTQNPNSHIMLSFSSQGSDDKDFLDEDKMLAASHAYTLYPQKDKNGEMSYILVNPWSTSKTITLNQQEFDQYVRNIYYCCDEEAYDKIDKLFFSKMV